MGTEEGLVRFDGVRFTVFNKANTPAFKHNDVQQTVGLLDEYVCRTLRQIVPLSAMECLGNQ